MISPKTQLNLQHAKQYFRERLAVGDYSAVRTADYSAEENRLTGEWFGEGVARLNLSGIVGEPAFVAMCDGNGPWTGKRLTLRRRTVRRSDGKRVASRRVFYDFTISPPKSVSAVAILQDCRIVWRARTRRRGGTQRTRTLRRDTAPAAIEISCPDNAWVVPPSNRAVTHRIWRQTSSNDLCETALAYVDRSAVRFARPKLVEF